MNQAATIQWIPEGTCCASERANDACVALRSRNGMEQNLKSSRTSIVRKINDLVDIVRTL
jgi:hypothetical protein